MKKQKEKKPRQPMTKQRRRELVIWLAAVAVFLIASILVGSPDRSETVQETMRGGFTVRVTYVRENRAYFNQRIVDVPWTNKQLTVKWESFRSKLLPGQKETWTAAVRKAITGAMHEEAQKIGRRLARQLAMQEPEPK